MDTHQTYRELRSRAESLLAKQPLYQFRSLLLTSFLLAASLSLIVLFPRILWIQVPNALFLGFVFTQVAFLGHDSGHMQVSRKVKKNKFFGYLSGFITGISWAYWVKKHNEHHANPNEHDDPDIDILWIAFSEEQAREKKGVMRKLIPYQAFYFFFILPFQSVSMRVASFSYLLSKNGKRWELLSLLGHTLLYFGFLFTFLPLWHAVLFILLHQGFFGLYLASVFAPNHKGMLMPEKGSKLDYVRLQTLTARNVKPGWLTDYVYGGLNYQIEHHLFPSTPRNKLRQLRKIVRAFCEEKGISYHETSVLQSYKEILQHLHQVGKAARA